MKIVRTALTGPAASTFFAEFLIGDQSETDDAYDWEMQDDLLDLERTADTEENSKNKGLGYQPLTPRIAHPQER